ncbi:6314_t:CDS:1, partial [Funneliformis mosseae]
DSFAPRSFRIFPMIAINFNTISNFYWDEKDEENCFCILITLEDYEG